MSDNSPETPRPTEKCGTCALLEPFHEFNGVMYSTCPHAKPENHCLTSPLWIACTHYTPKNTD